MSTAYAVAYHGLAAVAMLAHLVVNGVFSLLLLAWSSAAGTELQLFILKSLVVVSWFGLGWLGLRAWARRSWLVVAVPIASFSILWGDRVDRRDLDRRVSQPSVLMAASATEARLA